MRKSCNDMSKNELEMWHFAGDENTSNYLLDLVLAGRKRASSSSLEAYRIQDEDIPKVGELSIVTDWNGRPRCVIKTTNVQIIPYRDITFEIAQLEGEDDSLDSWREKHAAFFMREGKELGYEFSEDMGVIFEEFELVEIIKGNK